jgi:predicted RNase H-like HicB family nuclease
MHNLIFTEQLIREGNILVAYCPELDVSSCGATGEQARENLRTAIRLFLEEAARMGTLLDILTEAGYDITRPVLTSPVLEITQQTMSLEGVLA